MGKVLLAALPPDELATVLAEPTRSGITARLAARSGRARPAQLDEVRAKGWALADQDLAPGIRSVATSVRDGDGTVVAAINVTVHAAETSVERLTEEYLPLLLRCAADIGHDWSLMGAIPLTVTAPRQGLVGVAGEQPPVGVGGRLDAPGDHPVVLVQPHQLRTPVGLEPGQHAAVGDEHRAAQLAVDR